MMFEEWLKSSPYASATEGQGLMARRAYEAGRLQGLREAEEVARQIQRAAREDGSWTAPLARRVAKSVADAIAIVGRAG